MPYGRVRVVGPDGAPVWGIVIDDGRIVLSERRADAGWPSSIDEVDATYLPPLEIPPTKIVAVHLNFASRISEYKAQTPTEPSYFLKPPSALNAHRSEVVRPAGTAYLNYEGEIALVIGTAARGVTLDEAMGHVAGVTLANDLGLHDFRHADRGSMLRVKGQDGFCPIGPSVLPTSELDMAKLTLRTLVNGTVVQEGRTSEMLFSYAYLVADLARVMTLEPGDIILTGTPANSRPLDPGDVVEVEVDEIGRLTNTIVEKPVDWLGIGAQPEDSANARHVALAIPEAEAEAGAGRRY